MAKRKLEKGYEKKKNKKVKKHTYVSHLFLAKPKEVSAVERIVKLIIYIALRLVIKPSKWKLDKEKNYKVIDHVYKRIMSADFIYIPSSLAFHFIMAFVPMLMIIVGITSLIDPGSAADTFGSILREGVRETLGRFIPGVNDVIDQLSATVANVSSKGTAGFLDIHVGGLIALFFTFLLAAWISASGFAKLVFTQSYIFKHKYIGGYWMNKIKGIFMTIAFATGIIMVLSINILTLYYIKEDRNLSELGKTSLKYFFLVVTLFIGTFIGIIVLFRFSPRFKIKVRNILPGSLVVTIPTVGFLALFGTISSIWNYSTYGTVGLIMYIGMSSLIFSYFLFVGIATNDAYYKTFVADKMQTKWTISKK